jgi:hypothetical protein
MPTAGVCCGGSALASDLLEFARVPYVFSRDDKMRSSGGDDDGMHVITSGHTGQLDTARPTPSTTNRNCSPLTFTCAARSMLSAALSKLDADWLSRQHSSRTPGVMLLRPENNPCQSSGRPEDPSDPSLESVYEGRGGPVVALASFPDSQGHECSAAEARATPCARKCSRVDTFRTAHEQFLLLKASSFTSPFVLAGDQLGRLAMPAGDS